MRLFDTRSGEERDTQHQRVTNHNTDSKDLLEQVPSEYAASISADRWLHDRSVASTQQRFALQRVTVSYQAMPNFMRRAGKPSSAKNGDTDNMCSLRPCLS